MIDTCLEDLSWLWYEYFGVQLLNSQSADKAVGSYFSFWCFVAIASVISDGIIGWKGYREHNEPIFSERVGANEEAVYVPVVFEIVVGEPIYSLRASIELVGLQEIIEEG
jgi:hypothetical protein